MFVADLLGACLRTTLKKPVENKYSSIISTVYGKIGVNITIPYLP